MSNDRWKILIADDDQDVVAALRLVFKAEPSEIVDCNSPEDALALAKSREFDLALIDLNYREDTTSGREGLRLLTQLQRVNPDLPVVVMTAWSSVSIAVQAMQRGAGDFIEKPWDNQRLLSIVRNQLELGRSRRSEKRLAAENALLRGAKDHQFIAEAAATRSAMDMVHRVASSSASILVTGEHGTGKSLLARRIHALSKRSGKTLVTVNVGGLAESVFESEMFGHVKGAFTDAVTERVGRFEMADGGTIFLDEIANIPKAQQAKLLRVLEEGEFERVGSSRTQAVDVRVISATNTPLAELKDEKTFRQDLLFRLNTVEISLPPLRSRTDDIEPLCALFLGQARGRYGGGPAGFTDAAFAALKSHPWPGNVRELNHVVERALLMSGGDQIDEGDLQLSQAAHQSEELDVLPLEQAERRLIETALQRNDNNVLAAAKDLGLSRSAMYRRLDKHGLKDPEES